MKKNIGFALMLFLLFAFVSCSKSEQENLGAEDFVSFYGGTPFKGNAKGVLSKDGQTIYEWNGDGRVAIIESTADSASIVFMADFGNQGEINFKMRGAYSGLDYRSSDQNRNPIFMISDHLISGEVINQEQQMIFQGSMEKYKTILNTQVQFMKATEPFPEGSVLNLTIDAERSVEEGDSDSDGCHA